jgi:hypothetical protein
MLKKCLALLILVVLALPLEAADHGEVMLFGTFHFQDAGLDTVKSKDVDVFTTESQAYLAQLAERLAGTAPTKVLLEYAAEEDEEMNRRYREYLAGTYEPGANEIYQLGFRIAKMAGLSRVHSFDNRDIEWQADAMFEYAKENNSPEMDDFNSIIETFTADEAQARASLSLRDLLIRANNPEMERLNMDLYLATNAIGAGDGYAGAVAASSWWARNFRMYANIQKLAGPGQRLIAIGGAGHMAILKQLLAIDRRLQQVDVAPYL